MLVHIFGAMSSPCCTNKAVHQTTDNNEEQFDPDVTRTVCRNFYVHDILKSVPNEGCAIWLAQQLIELMKKGGFHLTKFSSNSRKFLAMLPEKERANPELNLDLDVSSYWTCAWTSFRHFPVQSDPNQQATDQTWHPFHC